MGITDFSRKYKVDEMAKGDVVLFATGVTSGSMLSGISQQNGVIRTETLRARRLAPFAGLKRVAQTRTNST